MKLSYLLYAIYYGSTSTVRGRLSPERRALVGSSFPAYSQQCNRDEGPRVEDDEENFGVGKKYHFGSPATPVLKENGECADPLKSACDLRNDPKLAYLEGPISCGGNGFYCTVVEQEGWEPRELLKNLNFGYCNTTEAFDSIEYQEDGHCHGSDDDSAYYWVLRDHWFRQYNGRLRCCCNWDEGDVALVDGKFTNRCDYRRRIPERQERECRNANRAGLNFEDGCDPSLADQQLDEPVPENNAQCWDVTSFGQPKASYDEESEICEDDAEFRYQNDSDRDCSWVGLRPDIRCEREMEGVDLMDYCPRVCGLCPDDDDDELDWCVNDLDFRFRNFENRDCDWVERNPDVRCERFWDGIQLKEFCPVSCGGCA